MPEDLVITGRRVLIEDALVPATLTIRAGQIHTIDFKSSSQGPGVVDAGDLCILPGLVDTHVHVNEPGRTHWEGFETAGMAAAAGGITTIVVMPLNCTPAATTVAALMSEVQAARGVCRVDYGFWGGIVPGNAADIEPMWNAGALGFKAFMVDSGVEDFPGSNIHDLEQAAPILARLQAPFLVHSEDPDSINSLLMESWFSDNPRSYSAYLSSRPPESEFRAVVALMRLCGSTKPDSLRLHIVHVSDSELTTSVLRGFRPHSSLLSCETCPHYLTFTSENIPDGATEYKCAPPIRSFDNRISLWNAMRAGVIDMVVSDHSPCPPELKCLDTGDFSKAWGGISSLQLSLSATWTGAHARGFSLADIARWMCENPAKLAGIADRKGHIAPGVDADLIFFDPDAEWTVRAADLYHRHKLTPYDGRVLRGAVRRTILRGTTVFDADQHPPFPTEPIGQWIKRGTR